LGLLKYHSPTNLISFSSSTPRPVPLIQQPYFLSSAELFN
jgi:hypothetical protein